VPRAAAPVTVRAARTVDTAIQFHPSALANDMILTSLGGWRERHGRDRLEASKCAGCGEIWFPRRHGVCPSCHSRELDPYQCPHTGEVTEFIIKDNPPTDRPGTQYRGRGNHVIAIVRLDDGLLVAADLEDCQPADVHPGMRVQLVTRKRTRESGGDVRYGYRFAPA
jgi:scaffold protein (connect acetoacetyl-CoA thiolase and HMG-CoA synthase)